MQANVIELIFLLLAHAAAGIYSSTLKYSKKTTYIIWGVWVAVQSMIMFFAESVLPMSPLLFLISFILPLIGQYVIFFATTKGRLAQRLFTMLTYSIFFLHWHHILPHGESGAWRAVFNPYHAHSSDIAFRSGHLFSSQCVRAVPHCSEEYHHRMDAADHSQYHLFDHSCLYFVLPDKAVNLQGSLVCSVCAPERFHHGSVPCHFLKHQ